MTQNTDEQYGRPCDAVEGDDHSFSLTSSSGLDIVADAEPPRSGLEILGEVAAHDHRLSRHRNALPGPSLSEHERGVIEGKLSALRWVLGEEWDAPRHESDG